MRAMTKKVTWYEITYFDKRDRKRKRHKDTAFETETQANDALHQHLLTVSEQPEDHPIHNRTNYKVQPIILHLSYDFIHQH